MCVFVGARRFPLQFDICSCLSVISALQWTKGSAKRRTPKEDGDHGSMSIAQRYRDADYIYFYMRDVVLL